MKRTLPRRGTALLLSVLLLASCAAQPPDGDDRSAASAPETVSGADAGQDAGTSEAADVTGGDGLPDTEPVDADLADGDAWTSTVPESADDGPEPEDGPVVEVTPEGTVLRDGQPTIFSENGPDYCVVYQGDTVIEAGNVIRLGGAHNGLFLRPGYFMGGTTQIYDPRNGTMADSGLTASNYGTVRMLPNGLVAIIGYYQGEIDGVRQDTTRRTLLLDADGRPAEVQLRFSAGIDLDEALAEMDLWGTLGHQYEIISLIYRQDEARYYAVFRQSGYAGLLSGGAASNALCGMGVAVFDQWGRELDWYLLDDINYPNAAKYGGAFYPHTVQISAHELLLFPQVDMQFTTGNNFGNAPYYINLHTRSASRWPVEDVLEMMEGWDWYHWGVYQGHGGDFRGWDLINSFWPVAGMPLRLEEYEEDGRPRQAVYLPGGQEPAAVIGADYLPYLFTRDADGRCYAVFRRADG